MRQVFSSPRLENVESVAKLLSDAGIEVRVTHGRSYKGGIRSRASYSDDTSPKPAVWIVKSEDQLRAREILRDNGLIDSTKPGESFITPSFRFEEPATAKSSAQKRAFRIKLGLLAVIVVVLALVLLRGLSGSGQVATPAPIYDGRVVATPETVAMVVFAKELPKDNVVICVAADGTDASAAVIAALQRPSNTVVPASECVRVNDVDTGSHHAASGRPAMFMEVKAFRPTSADAGTIEFESFQHASWAHYKTYEVRRVQGTWQVGRLIRHVAAQAMVTFTP